MSLPRLEPKKSRILSYAILAGAAKRRNLDGIVDIANRDETLSNPLYIRFEIPEETSVAPKKGFIAGSVLGLPEGKKGRIVLYLSDGRTAMTDARGRYHFEGVSPGTQVVQIDTATIPDGYKPKICVQNTANAGSAISRFVRVRAGVLKLVDFCLEKAERKKTPANERENKKKIEKKTSSMPHYGIGDLAKYEGEGYRWLWPPTEGYVPAIGSIKAALYYPKNQKLTLYLNEKEVDPLNYEGSLADAKYSGAIARYRGIDIMEGDNYLKAEFRDKEGKLLRTLERKVHLSGAPAEAVLVPEASYLVADAKRPAVIALRLLDRYGYPVRESMQGRFVLDPPYEAYEEEDAQLQTQKNIFRVEKGGVTRIKLQPTALSGEVKLHLPLEGEEEPITVRLKPKMREWILVGFAEGTVGYRKIRDNMQKGVSDKVLHEGRLSFFAKGRIRGQTLLTIAYDSGKEPDLELFDRIDPTRYYTIYADASLQGSEAPSRRKLYIKMENETYTLLFGDMHTGLDRVKLARYDRALTGFKAVLESNETRLLFFASDTDSRFVKEEISPDGTSGLYRLKHRRIVENSEKITLVVRDRYRHDLVLSKKVLTPLIDYTIYYEEGKLYFKEPIFGRDQEGNPRFIEIDYEISGKGRGDLIYGGRASWTRKDEGLGVGVNYVKEPDAALGGVDMESEISKNTRFRAEYARTFRQNAADTDAYYLDLKYRDRTRYFLAYLKRTEREFGLAQQSRFETDSMRYGMEGKISYRKNYHLDFAAYRDRRLSGDSTVTSVEAKNSYTNADTTLYLGYRYFHDLHSGSQLLGGVSRKLFGSRLRFQLTKEYLLSGVSETFPDRTALNLSYMLTKNSDLFARSEIVKNDTGRRMLYTGGVVLKPWEKGMFRASVASSAESDGESLYSNYIFQQGYQVNKNLTLNGGIEKNIRLRDDSNDSEPYTSYTASATYQRKNWTYSLRGAYKKSRYKRVSLDLGVYTQKRELNLGLAFGIRAEKSFRKEGDDHSVSANLAMAYRPQEGKILLGRFDYVDRKSGSARTKQYTNTLLFSQKMTPSLEIALQYALKFTRTYLEGKHYDSWIDLASAEATYDLNGKTDVGFHASMRHYWKNDRMEFGSGVFAGYNLFENGWLGVGYNFDALTPQENIGSDFRTQDIYLRLRMKYDQMSLKEMAKRYMKR